MSRARDAGRWLAALAVAGCGAGETGAPLDEVAGEEPGVPAPETAPGVRSATGTPGDLPLAAVFEDRTAEWLPEGAERPAAVRGAAACDADGDGLIDLVTLGEGGARLWRNLGGALAPDDGRLAPADAGDARSVLCADLTGDRRPELYLSAGPSGAHRLYAGTPARLVEATHLLPSSGGDARAALAADLDGDGVAELIAIAREANGAHRAYRLRDAGWESLDAAFPEGAGPARGAAAADFDLDGDLDLALAGAGPVRLLYGDGRGALALAPPGAAPAEADARACAAGDLDGDGAPDLLCAGPGQDRLLLSSHGRLSDWTPELLPAEAREGRAVALADLDLDGDLDAAIADREGARLLLNDGTARLFDYSSRVPAAASFEAVLAADWDGDGAPDLVFAGDDARMFIQSPGAAAAPADVR